MILLMLSRRATGFTIVELLIVIVVIAILAAITVVAYNGIQTRAENTKTITAVSAYARAIRSYASINGAYPVTGVGVFACLGTPPSAKCGNVTDATSGACGGDTVPAVTVASFDTAIKTIITSLPQPSIQSITCGTRNFVGAHYFSTNGTAGYIAFYLRGNQACNNIGGLENMAKTYTSDVTVCGAQLPTIP